MNEISGLVLSSVPGFVSGSWFVVQSTEGGVGNGLSLNAERNQSRSPALRAVFASDFLLEVS
ncbi:MAG: hypothetical protein ACO3A2_01585 [Bdellovibrionia bacterium]